MRHRRTISVAFALAFLLLAGTAGAEELCPCVPQTPLWIVKTCDTWNCAISALVDANGDPFVFAMPADSDGRQWVVMRRVYSGSYQDDGSDPHVLEQFDGMEVASARFASIASGLRPMMLSAPDGRFLVVSARDLGPKRRAVGH